VRTIGFNGGETAKLNSVKALGFERRGYAFVGWATSTEDARNKKVWKKDMGLVSQPVTNGNLLKLYAIWKMKSGYYSIRFNKNDDSGKWRELGYEYGANTTLPTIENGLNWARDDYKFGGWATSAANAANGIVWRGDKGVTRTPVTAGKTLNVYAIWKNYTDANDYFEDEYFGYDGNATADGRLNLSVGITNLDDFLPSLRMNSPTAKLAVSGLPAGLKYDAANGKIVGIATKAGTYTVTLTVIDGKAKYVSTITVEVEALPDWVVGTFYGVEYDRPVPYEEDEVPWEGGNFWDVTMTVSSVGKVSGKLFETNGKVMYTVEGVLIDNNDGSFMIKGWASDEKDDVEYLPITKSYSYGGVELGRIDFESNYYWEDGERWVQDWMLIQDVYSNYPKSEKIPILRKGIILKDEITDSDIGISGEVRLSFDSKGVVVGEFKPFANIHMTQSKDTGRLILASYDECEDVVYAYVLMSFTHTSNYDHKNHIGMIYKLKIKNLSDVTSNSIEIVEAFYRYD
jgi:hypothetical protein